MRGRARGRFDVVFTFGDGYIRFTSDPKKSLAPQDVIDQLTEFFPHIRAGIAADKRAARKRIRRRDLEAL